MDVADTFGNIFRIILESIANSTSVTVVLELFEDILRYLNLPEPVIIIIRNFIRFTHLVLELFEDTLRYLNLPEPVIIIIRNFIRFVYHLYTLIRSVTNSSRPVGY